MSDSNPDLFDPRTAIMDSSDYTSEVGRGDGHFGFAFNDSNFSDRILRIEIISVSTETRADGEGCTSLADWARNRKRRREDIKRENAVDMSAVGPEEQILNQPDNIPDDLDTYNQDGTTAAMIEEPPSGDEGANDLDSNWSMECSTVVRVRTLHISSPILAAKSPFFYKLFSNGMRESEQRHVTLRINASEEAALMELLNFMYSNSLTVTTAPALLDVLLAADKFEVASCMRCCSRALRNLDMTPESALLCLDHPSSLDLPSSVLMAEAVQALSDAAKQSLAVHYKDITKFLQDEVLNLPLAGVEAILASDDLQVASEDSVYDFVLKWSGLHYPKTEERREILATRLAQFIRFPYMTGGKLRIFMASKDFDHDFIQKMVVEALIFRAKGPYRQRTLAGENPHPNRRFIARAYKYLPVKVVEFEQPRQKCVAYLELKREECEHLFPSGQVYSQAFHLGGQGFFLSAHCNPAQSSSHCFGLFIGMMQVNGSATFAVDYEFSARSKPTEEYISKYKGNYTFKAGNAFGYRNLFAYKAGKAVGYRNLFAIPWTSFMAEDSVYFINGILHLRVELTVRH